MTVVRVRKIERVNQGLKILDQAVPHVGVHEVASPLELLATEIGAILENRPNPFFMHHVRPFGPEQIGQRQAHQKVPKRRGIQDARVIERRKARHTLITHVQLLGLSGQLIEGLATLPVDLSLVCQKIVHMDATVGADLAVRNFPLLQKPHEMRA